MDINKSVKDDLMTLVVTGRLETATSTMLQAEVTGLAPEVRRLLLDISGVEYVSSAGLRVILLAHKEISGRGGRLEVAGANPVVKRVFDIAGFSPILNLV